MFVRRTYFVVRLIFLLGSVMIKKINHQIEKHNVALRILVLGRREDYLQESYHTYALCI